MVGGIVLAAATTIVARLRFFPLLRLASDFCLTPILGFTTGFRLAPRFGFVTCLGLALNIAGLCFAAERHEISMRLGIITLAAEVPDPLSIVGATAMGSRDIAAGGQCGK